MISSNPLGETKGNVVYAANERRNTGASAESEVNSERFKTEFTYEMAQVTSTIISIQTTNIEIFKAEFAYATAKVTAKIMPIIPGAQSNEFAYEMAQTTTKIISDPNLQVEKAKAQFAYEIAQLTSRIIMHANEDSGDNGKVRKISTGANTTFVRNNADIEPKATIGMNNTSTGANTALLRNNADIETRSSAGLGYIAPETYTGLVNELMHFDDSSDKRINVDGEIRYHYALNSGSGSLGRNSSGLRVYLGFDAQLNEDWHAYGMLEGKKNILNYDSEVKLSRLYAAGKVGATMVRAGRFGYLMAEGNIYDSSFDGISAEFGGPVKYTVSHGKTNETKDTTVATARYEDYDYNLEAGVYHYQMDDGSSSDRNTIWTVGGNYNFSNFGIGAMALRASLKDSKGNGNGYVLGLNYGELKTWRAGTYGIFAKYYNQPRYTYIGHGMNGMSYLTQGFRGYGAGLNYTLMENFVIGLEYYDLTDKITGEDSNTWWSQVTHYF